MNNWLVPQWPAPVHVHAVCTTRTGGTSFAPYDSLNLGAHVGDDATDLDANRAILHQTIRAQPVFLSQVHGVDTVSISAATVPGTQADGAITDQAGIACTVLVADCLPLLLCSANGRGVAAAHAGWRGLAAGVIDDTVAALCAAAGCPPGELLVWLGPCIGQPAFEVGKDVLLAFGADLQSPDPQLFLPSPRPDGSPRWRANLVALARRRLLALGVQQVSGGAWCTASDNSSFFSFRRQACTGRMAAAIALRR